MQKIVLENLSPDGNRLAATFLPEKGMNLISYKSNDLEIIEQSTQDLFDERLAGLGALIGPHFHHRTVIPPIKDESLFPHIARIRAKGIKEPFSHGIARYAPWKVISSSPTTVVAEITGKDTWHDVPLSALEGQNFKMTLKAELKPSGLHLTLSVVSDTASLVGIHYYYALPNGKGKVISKTKENHQLEFDLDKDVDQTFHPYPNPLAGTILLETETYQLKTHYTCLCEENCWQLYHPEGAKFVCIEPISSQVPKYPNLTVSSLNIHLEILTPGVKS